MKKKCSVCGAEFLDRSQGQHGRYCSEGCKSKVYYAANREAIQKYHQRWHAANREKENEASRAYAAAHREEALERVKAWKKANPDARREYDDRRRALRKGAAVASVDREAIYARDGYRCRLCGKKVKMTERFPHPLSPTIDHILPLSKGGTHEPRNVQLAHLGCNSRKRNTGVDQLRLLGE